MKMKMILPITEEVIPNLRKINKERNTYTRDEIMEWFSLGFDISRSRWYNMKEMFIIDQSDPIDVNIHYLYYQDPYRIREIYLTTWAGGWENQQRSIHIEASFDYSYYDMVRNFTKHTPLLTIKKEKISKEEVLDELARK